MPRGHPVDPAARARVQELHSEGWSRNAIAREVGISGYSVTKIVREFGLNFDRETTKAATEAKVADNRARRAELSANLLGDAERLREQLWSPVTIGAFGGRDGEWHTAEVEEPPFADKRAILASVQTAVRSHVELVKADASSGADEAASMLGKLAAGLKQAWGDSDAGVPADEPQTGGVDRDQ
ncbi:AraC-like DNA-binding protein [Lipingzhangella halophila]|uniref:AraC-like DNA-binding protein n=1 Tax=Lipingzhangella halophila TaxID=1783352 RepID=A0A7W7W2W1_9ACTN|nr:helix-turn-helix domain-containing protein [Lipingzhangella halophila]MBB4931858.1 AraC-like DNA-binding protein [Lipingzhangella halophila]